MKKLFGLLTLGALALGLTGTALALEFSADMVRTGPMGQTSGKIYIKDGKVRMDNQRGPTGPGYTIARQDLKVVWMVNPAQKSYMEISTQAAGESFQQHGGEDKAPGEISRKEVGREVIDGHPCVKYEVTHQQGGTTLAFYHWMATDIKFPIKRAAKDGSWSVEYKNINTGSQPDSLFEPPAGFQKMAMPQMGQGMGPGMGQGMGGRPGMGQGRKGGMGQGMGQGMPPGQADD